MTGGFVYRGSASPRLAGKYICGDFETRRVWAAAGPTSARLTSVVEIGRAPDQDRLLRPGRRGRTLPRRLRPGDDLPPRHASHVDPTPTRTVEVVATARTAATSWRYTLGRPAGDAWARDDFDDAAWTPAPGGFGTPGTPGAVVRTGWTAGAIWLRREFHLADLDPSQLTLAVHHDEDAEIYLNGVLAATLPGFTGGYDDAVAIRPEARATLRAGPNRLAVHCRQTGGGQYIDVGIVAAARCHRDGPSGILALADAAGRAGPDAGRHARSALEGSPSHPATARLAGPAGTDACLPLGGIPAREQHNDPWRKSGKLRAPGDPPMATTA